MKKMYWLLDTLFLLLFVSVMLSAKKQTSILFIGNSYTYRNEMPKMVQKIAETKGRDVYVGQCVQGKATFLIQSKRPEVYDVIRSRKWDVIILQGSSRDFLRDSSFIEQKSIPALKKLMAAINTANPHAKKLFYMTWGYKNGYKPHKGADSYRKMTELVSKRYMELKNKFTIDVVPVGVAWYNARQNRNSIDLYVEDGAHPSLKGSYLAACCFYAKIFNEKPLGVRFYSNLKPKTCWFLQRIATQTVFESKKESLEKSLPRLMK